MLRQYLLAIQYGLLFNPLRISVIHQKDMLLFEMAYLGFQMCVVLCDQVQPAALKRRFGSVDIAFSLITLPWTGLKLLPQEYSKDLGHDGSFTSQLFNERVHETTYLSTHIFP